MGFVQDRVLIRHKTGVTSTVQVCAHYDMHKTTLLFFICCEVSANDLFPPCLMPGNNGFHPPMSFQAKPARAPDSCGPTPLPETDNKLALAVLDSSTELVETYKEWKPG